MAQLYTTKKPVKLFETVFDSIYLGTVLLSAVRLYMGSAAGSPRRMFGIMALILGVGDSFHLIPRLYVMWNNQIAGSRVWLGVGKMIASVTMTVFYVVLWGVAAKHYPNIVTANMTVAVYSLAALRIVLCLFPQNGWTSEKPPLRWAVWRNIPFFVLGMFVIAVFAAGSQLDGHFPFLWLAVLLSFACYLPVVLFSHRMPRLGMLMIPKSCAYAAIVLMGFSLSGI